MADRKAIVAGSVSYIEIGAAGGTTDYLDIGPAGITGTSGYATMNIRVNQDGVGDKTMVIGEQGSTPAGNVIHLFGSTDALLNGTVKIHGNLQVDGTENVAGNATFQSNATFQGNTIFGDANTDWVQFVADVNSDIRFDANTGSSRTLGIETESGAANPGTDLHLQAGDAGATYAGLGSNVYLIPAGGTAVSDYGSVYIGNSGAAGSQTGYQILCNNTPGLFRPGLRYDDLNNVWQIRTDTTDWTNIASGSVLPSGSLNQILENDGAGNWVSRNDLTLPSGAASPPRTITVDDTGVTTGETLLVKGGDGTGTNAGGLLNLTGGAAPGTGASGGVTIQTLAAVSSGNTGNVTISTGNVTSAVAGNISMTAGTASLSGTGGDVSIAAGGAQTGGSPGDVSITAGGATGANGGTNGGLVTVTGGSTDDGTGGSVTIAGGAASFGTTGGSTYIRGGASGSGTAGTVWIGDTNTNQIVFGLGGDTDNAIYANSDTAADRAGLRYNDLTDKWQYHLDGGGATWIDFGAGTVPNGALNYQILRWDSTLGTPAWVTAENLTLPAGTTRVITIEPNDAAGTTLVVAGHDNLTATGDGGGLWLYGGAASGSGDGGGIQMFGGSATSSPGVGGPVQIEGGLANDGTPANVIIGGFSNATVYIGDSTGTVILGGTGETDTAFYANSNTTGDRAGVRYNDTTEAWQVHLDGGGVDWYDILTTQTSAALPPSTDQYTVLQGSATLGEWVEDTNLTLPNGGTRTISVQGATAAGNGNDLYLHSGAPDTSGRGGYLWIYVPTSVGTADGNDIDMNAGDASTQGNGGSIWIHAGDGKGTANGGNVHIEAGDRPDAASTGAHVMLSPGTAPGGVGGFSDRGRVIMGNARQYPLTEHHCPHFQFWNDPASWGHATIDCLTETVACNLTVAAGPSTAAANVGGNLYLNAGTGSTDGIVHLGGTNTSEVVFGNGGSAVTDNALYANSDTAATRAGIGYDDGADKWQVRLDGNATWYDILTSGNSEPVPTGAADGEIMEWDQTGTQAWIVAQDLALPDGLARTIGMKPHTAATAAYALTVSGQANTSVGPGTTTGGNLTVKGGDSTAENGGDLLLAGGVGSAANGDILFGDGSNPFNIDFHYSSGNRINSNMVFADKAAPGSWSIYPQTANTTVGTGMLLSGAQGGATATGGFQGGGMALRGGYGGASLGTGNGGNAGNVVIGGDPGGAGGTGGAGGDGADVSISGGNAGAVGATGGQGGAISAVCGASTGNIGGPNMTLTAGAAVGTASAGNMLITAGANSSTGNGGYVQITGGASTGGTAGSLILDAGAGSTNGSIAIGPTNATTIQFGQGANTFDMTVGSSPPVFSASGTATIDLPGTAAATNNFRIQGVAVSDNVDAPNLGTLTAGPASDASALHTHTGLGNSFTKEAGEALADGDLVSIARESTDSNNPKAWKCDTSASPADDSNSPIPAGFTQAAYADGATATIIVAGEVTIPSGRWTGGAPAKTSIGSLVYADATDGQLSLTPPASGTGLYRTKVGILTDSDGATTTKVLVQIGDPLLMA